MITTLIYLLYLMAALNCDIVSGDAGENTGQCIISSNINNGYIYLTNRDGENKKNELNQIVANFGEIKYSCVFGYTLIGKKRNVCVNGIWVHPLPKCELLCSPKDLLNPTIISICRIRENAKWKYVNCAEAAYPGTIAEINCRQGYTNQKTEQQIVTCASNGNWYPKPSTCAQVCGEEGRDKNMDIVGGLQTNLTRVPWNVGIYHRTKGDRSFQHICGGTIINARVVLTAMHCFWVRSDHKSFEIKDLRVVAGKFYRDFEREEKQHTEIRLVIRMLYITGYDDYRGLYENDIAVIVLNTYLDFYPHISPVCLDYDKLANEPVVSDSIGRVAGWGLQESNSLPSSTLKFIELSVIDREQCIEKSDPVFIAFITNGTFCGGYPYGHAGVCKGDGGAGLASDRIVDGKQRFYLKGIVSTGPNKHGSCDYNKYTTFTNVTHFIDFIKSIEIPYRPEYNGIGSITNFGLFTEVQSTSCTITDVPINGFVMMSDTTVDQLKFGDIVENEQLIIYTCNANLTLIGSSRNICLKGEWIYDAPSCSVGSSASIEIEKPCRIMNELENGWIDFPYLQMKRLLFGDAINSGSNIDYHCENDFLLVGRDNNLCENGVWEHATPVCVSTCSLNVLDNILIRGVKCRLNGDDISCSNHTQSGTSLEIDCSNAGFGAGTRNSQETICESNGHWSVELRSCDTACGKDETPWKAVILDGNNIQRCQGTILSPILILASSFCFWNRLTNELDDVHKYHIAVGDASQSKKLENTNFYEIHSIVFNKSYELSGYSYDTEPLGMAILARPIEYNHHIIPVCLFPGNDYERVLRFGKSGEIPDLQMLVSYKESSDQLDVINKVTIDSYRTWVIPELKMLEEKKKG